MGNLKHSTVNDHRLSDLLKDVRQLGRDGAEGADSLPRLAVRVVQAAVDGVIDLEKDKHGEGVDDARKIYTEYVEAFSGKAVNAHTVGGIKANASKLRQFVKLGGMTSIDPMEVIERVAPLRNAMVRAEQKVRPAYHAMVEVARKQLERDQMISDEEIKECIAKSEADDPTVEKVLGRIEKQLERLITGEAGCKDQDERVIQAHDLIRERLAALIQQREDEELLRKYEELHAKFGRAGEGAKAEAAKVEIPVEQAEAVVEAAA